MGGLPRQEVHQAEQSEDVMQENHSVILTVLQLVVAQRSCVPSLEVFVQGQVGRGLSNLDSGRCLCLW